MERCSCFEEIIRALGVRDVAGLVHDYGHGGGQVPSRLTTATLGGAHIPRPIVVEYSRKWNDGWDRSDRWHCSIEPDIIEISIFFHNYVFDTGKEFEVHVHTRAAWANDTYDRAFFVSRMYDHGDALLATLKDVHGMCEALELDESWEEKLREGAVLLLPARA